jgi:hypothetical protein
LLAQRFGAIELKEFTTEDAEDVTKPLILNSKFVMRRSAARKSGGLKLPSSWEDFYIAPEPGSDRKTPFERLTPIEIICDSTVEGLPGISLASTIQSPVSGKFGRGETVISQEGGKIRIKANCRLEPGEYKAGEYSDYTRCMTQMLDLFQPQIEITGEAKL